MVITFHMTTIQVSEDPSSDEEYMYVLSWFYPGSSESSSMLSSACSTCHHGSKMVTMVTEGERFLVGNYCTLFLSY